MRLRSTLLLGLFAAYVSFRVGVVSGQPLFATLNALDAAFFKAQVLGDAGSTELYAQNLASYPNLEAAMGALVFLALGAISVTVVELIMFVNKWIKERTDPRSVEEHDLGTEFGVTMIVMTLVSAAFACGIASYVVAPAIITVLMLIAALPTIFQLIDLLAASRHKSARAKRPDE